MWYAISWPDGRTTTIEADSTTEAIRRAQWSRGSAGYMEGFGPLTTPKVEKMTTFKTLGDRDAVPTKGHIEARRWQDGDGNTYHSVYLHTLHPAGFAEILCLSEYTYGYGDMWQQTARDCLGFEGTPARAGYTSSVVDVQRKRDL